MRDSSGRERERERERERVTNDSSTQNLPLVKTQDEYTDFHLQSERGVTTDSRSQPLNLLEEKITYEKMFYHIPKRKIKNAERERVWTRRHHGISGSAFPMVQQRTQALCLTDFQFQSAEEIGARDSSNVFSTSPIAQGAKINTVQYLGIASDEPKRIAKHKDKPGIILPLVDIGWNEKYCREWCEENNLLSPIYTTSARGGCWFCHNQGVDQLRILRKDYPELWQLLLKWDEDSPTSFKPDGHTVHDFEKRFQAEDDGKIKPGDKRFRWKQVLEEKENADENIKD